MKISHINKRINPRLKSWVNIILPLFFLVILGFFTCFYKLGDNSLWLDEGYTFYAVNHENLKQVVSHVIEKEQSPPLFFILTFFTYPIFSNAFSLRLISAIPIFLTGSLLFIFGKKFFSKEIALFSSALFLSSPLAFSAARDARMYGLLSLFCILSAFFFYLSLNNGKIKNWILFVVFSCLALFTHFLAGIFLFSLGLFFLFSRFSKSKKAFLNFSVSAISIIIIFLPWIYIFLEKQLPGISGSRNWATSPDLKKFGTILLDIFGSNILVLIIFLLFLIILIFDFRKKNFNREKFLILISASLLPLLISFLISQKTPIFESRYFIFLVPFFMLLLGLALENKTKKKLFFLTFFITILFFFLSKSFYEISHPKENWKEIAEILKMENKKNIIVHTPSIALPLRFYKVENLKPFPDSFNFREYEVTENDKQEFLKLLKKETIFVEGKNAYIHENPKGLMQKWINEKCSEEKRQEFSATNIIYLKCQ